MGERIIRTSYKITIIILVFFLFLPSYNIAQGYDLSYDDVQGDVLDSKTGQTRTSGYEHIDILQISSMELEAILNPQLVFQITVVGVITNSDDITYTLFIMDGEEAVYFITYSNGIATGINAKDDSMDILQATGTGTDTLEVSVQLSDVGDVADYDFGSVTMEYMEAEDRYFLDTAGNSDFVPEDISDIMIYQEMPVSIIDPKFGATVGSTKTIRGVTSSEFEMESVEVQVDSQSGDGWIMASTNDNWGNWSYNLNTQDLSDGKHRLYARAYNGTEYFLDFVEIFIDSENENSRETTGMGKISVGDWFHYEIEIDLPDIGESVSISSTGFMNLTVVALEDISSGGNTYEAYKIEIEASQFYELEGSSYHLIQEGYDWLRSSDQANIRTELMTIYNIENDGEIHTTMDNITVEYDPPLDKYDFPISIGNSWTKTCTISYEIDISDELDNTFEGPYEFEALHKENVITPSGSHETFVIWSQDYFSFSKGIACNWDYYSPELGFPVKSESYDNLRNLYYTSELVDYEKVKEEEEEDTGIFGGEEANFLWLIIIIVIVLIPIIVLLIRKRRSNSRSHGFQDLTPLKPSVGALKPSDTALRSPLRFIKCQRCSQLLSIEKGEQYIKCPYCGLIQNA